MDDRRFDTFTRALAQGQLSRRRLVRALLGGAGVAGGAAALTSTAEGEAQTCLALDQLCVFGNQCCSGYCVLVGLGPLRVLQCACPPGTEPCQGDCKGLADYQTDPANCGACGVECAAPANATPTCTGGSCGFSCNAGFSPCGNGCCPSDLACCNEVCCAAGEVCSGAGGACGQPCDAGTHLCDGECVSDSSPDSCGTSCDPCPAPAGATATCDGSQCGFACIDGSEPCGSECCAAGESCDEEFGQCQVDACLAFGDETCLDADLGCCVGTICEETSRVDCPVVGARCVYDRGHGPCASECDCVGGFMNCVGGICCVGVSGFCEGDEQCCGALVCQGALGTCCRESNQSCEIDNQCCSQDCIAGQCA